MVTESKKSLASKLVKVMESVGFISKSGRNTAQNYDFVTDADVSNTIRKALVEQNVATVVQVGTIETVPFKTSNDKPQFLVTVQGGVDFIDGDTGETFTAQGVGQGADSGDKGVYKAITGMVKYALLKTFLVPTGDDPERDDAAPKAVTHEATSRGTIGKANEDGGSLTPKQKALIKIKMREAGLEGQQMVAFANAVVGKRSTNDMNSADMDALLEALKEPTLVAAAQVEKE